MSRAAPASLPSSPKATRSSSDLDQLPVTPQRVNRGSKQFRSASSPLTPARATVTLSPFTPLTNLSYSPSSSATPSSASSGTRVDSSPENAKTRTSVADAAGNWRVRAKENGIRVSANDSSDEDTFSGSKDLNGVHDSFLTGHRRSRQAQFQTKSSDITSLTTPNAARMNIPDNDTVFTPSPRKILSALNTPSPRTSSLIIEKLKLRGSLTDPARTRRRPAFGVTTGDTLFDIDENGSEISPYSQSFESPMPMHRAPRLRSVSDTCASIPVEVAPFMPSRHNVHLSLPFHRVRTSEENAHSSTADAKVKETPNTCSVCSSSSSPLSSLIPCQHLICSSCLTGALNIVGEKDMRCSSCEGLVKDFKLLIPLGLATNDSSNDEENVTPSSLASLLPSMFEDFKSAASKNKFDVLSSPEQSADTTMSQEAKSMDNELAVLRIDNVPWDITPPALAVFFEPHQIVRAHVLLETKGKTLSHAYVEVSRSQAKQALRSVQNKTMGKGRRMRGVTVTMSSQGELMRSLFPNWMGVFDGSKPTLTGLDNDRIVRALEYGLISLNDLDSLITLMRNPDSHFLKVPSLPFYSLVSILNKFPADIDSRVFWSSTLRDLLYDMTFAATHILLSRINEPNHDQQLLEQVVQAGVHCKIFSDHQRLKLIDLIDSISLSHSDRCPPSATCDSNTASSRSDELHTPEDTSPFSSESRRFFRPERHQAIIQHTPTTLNFTTGGLSPQSPYNALAREYGVEPSLVHAVAQRLTMDSPGVYQAIMGTSI